MESKSAAPHIQEEAIRMANRQVGHMVRLLDDLLDVSRITHGKIAVHRKRIDLCDVILPAIASLANAQLSVPIRPAGPPAGLAPALLQASWFIWCGNRS